HRRLRPLCLKPLKHGHRRGITHLGEAPDGGGTLPRMTTTPRVLECDVTVDQDRVARSALGGSQLPRQAEWWAEHLALAGLVRCTLASMDYAARRAGMNSTGSGEAHRVVTKREEDGLYA